jgi:hypothetical protein
MSLMLPESMKSFISTPEIAECRLQSAECRLNCRFIVNKSALQSEICNVLYP